MVPEKKGNPARGGERYALSSMQQGMLFHSLEAGASGVDVEQVVCELREEIDVACFEKAWREVVARHAILRTSFHWREGGEPKQIVHSAAEAPLDFSHEDFASETDARRAVEAYLASDRRKGFDVAAAPLLRVALIRADSACAWWVATFHHLVLDGRAMVVVFREAMDLHDAWVAGRSLELPVPRPYRAYIDWLQGEDWTRAEKFWRTQLAGFAAPTSLPIGRAAGEAPAEGPAHGELAVRLSETVTTRLRHAARRHEVTMNTLVQAAWALLLSRYAGEREVVFGAVRACRHIPVEGAGAMVGLFINTVPVRVQVDAGSTLAAWLPDLREQWLALRSHEHTPLMKIQQWSEIAPGRALFDTLVNYQEPSWDAALHALGGKWERRQFEIRSQPNYPLALDACGGATLLVKLLFDRRRFADEAIARMLGHYATILEAMADREDVRLQDLPWLTAGERGQLLETWNATTMDYPRALCAHTQFERHAAQSPGRIAVADAHGAITYEELNRRANRVAHSLIAHGVGRERVVAVCMDRSVEMIVAWLAVAKAGGAFVPLDPAYPKERLAFQLGDCGAAALLTQPHVRAMLPAAPASLAVVELRADGSGFENVSVENPEDRASGENLAYIIYTSGSTGQPKGVQIEHGSLANLVRWHQRTYAVTPDDRATHLASPAFDASIWEIWPYLASGASIHIPTEDTRLSPALLWRWMADEKITIAFMPTPLAEAAMNEAWPAGMALRALLTGGDKLQRPAPKNFPCALVNHYGPTESTVVATSGAVAGETSVGTPTIGRPIANARVYVLDANLQPVPAGVPGELFIGGEGLARGYWNRPTLTAEKFLPDPFSNGHGRLYRTGDLVRWRADGELEFLGRIDGQVKIRGYRIELGEIEATLQRHPAVREALVLARADGRGETQLAAYVVGRADAAPCSTAELTEFLRSKLPAYMVPAALVLLDAWPLTPNGKIDRRALPAPAVAARGDGEPAAPRSRTEETVAKTWSDVLARGPLGRNDNFFELGGHSLLAAQVISRLNAAFGATLSVRAIFDHPTVAAFAGALDARAENHAAPRAPQLRARRRASRAEMELVQPN